jgi:hypothetical protein
MVFAISEYGFNVPKLFEYARSANFSIQKPTFSLCESALLPMARLRVISC